ncbi:hypothetical protein M2263_000329 [Providencia alcalifaciens]|nr:hypothetical protein [Providencia alcalifaciens]
MKVQVIGISSLVAIAVISLILMSNNFNKSIKAIMSNIKLETMITCLEAEKCMTNEKFAYAPQKELNLKKEIKSFIRKKFMNKVI